jgi:CSLREA domain-containing protein
MPTTTRLFRLPPLVLVVLAALAASLIMIAVVLAGPAQAASLTVTTRHDELNSDGDCSLREAIEAANTNAGVDGCAAGSDTQRDTIQFAVGREPTLTVGSVLLITDDAGLTMTGQTKKITISGNDASRVFRVEPGAVFNLINLTVADGNTNLSGAGLRNSGGKVKVSNSTFSGNSAIGNNGGAILNGGTLTVSNSTFSGNGAPTGGGISVEFSTATLKNTIVANSTQGGDCTARFDGTIVDGRYNLEDDDTCGFSGANKSQSGVDPMRDPLANNGGPTQTMALQEGSPAIDKGKSFGATTDQRGQPRPVDFLDIPNARRGDGSGIGAYEVQP